MRRICSVGAQVLVAAFPRCGIEMRNQMRRDAPTLNRPNVSVTAIEMEDNRNGAVTKYGDISYLVDKVVETNADELTPHF